VGIGEVTARPPRARAVFLDRDGVLNHMVERRGQHGPPWSLEQLEIAPDASESLGRLHRAGFRLIVVTNQPDIARGDLDRATLNQINAEVHRRLPMLDRPFMVCQHDNADHCQCRKPRPGMLTGAALRLGLDLPSCYMVGDRYKDVEAGHSAGCRTVWIRAVGHREQEPSKPAHREVQSLGEAAGWILTNEGIAT